MPVLTTGRSATVIDYPESNGLPMANNTKQGRWIFILYGNLSALFHEKGDVFVAPDHLWYPVEGRPDIRSAPDVYVVFGRPKGDRGSYRQWEENNVPVTVVFEVLSPGNTAAEMIDKFAFYEDYGVEEYYIYDPDSNRLQVFVRKGEVLARVRQVDTYVSPRLGIRFDLSGPEMVVYGPDGKRFLPFEELQVRARVVEQQRDLATQQRDLAVRQLTRMAELSRKVRRGQASPEEVQELERLEEASGHQA